MNKLTHLDLFSGIGGFALAAKWVGFDTEAFCEIDPFCRKVLQKNFPDIPIFRDIKELSLSKHFDLVTGGFPCQPFSQAGNKRGKNDERYLWPEFLRIIKSTKATWVIVENVPGIVSMELDAVLCDLQNENYSTQTYIIPASCAKAPHRRDRVWIIAHNNSIRSNDRVDNRATRSIQENKIWNMEKIQQEWTQFIPDTWETFTARDWLQYNAKLSRRNDGIPNRLDKDRIKAIGNAIVPQVIFPILRLIRELENE